MRGGFVACFGPHEAGLLLRALEAFRWHHGEAVHHEGHDLSVAALAHEEDGPDVESGPACIRVAFGRAVAPVAEVEAADGRFAALECDGNVVRATRDAFGLAPLFYRPFAGAMWFSTEIGPLVALGDTGPDLEALVARMAYQPSPARTGWRGIWRVLPGERVDFTVERRVSSTMHWDPARVLGSYRGDRETAMAEFRERLEASVGRSQAKGCGILLSGGLDSAAVAAYARPSDGPPFCVHVSYPTLTTTDERDYARDVAASIGAPLEIVDGPITPWDPDVDLDVTGGVPYDWLPYGIEEGALGRMAREGVAVALDGHDGDGVVGPHGGEWGELATRGRLLRLAQLARQHGTKSLVGGLVMDLVPLRARVSVLRRFRPGPTITQRDERYFTGPLRESLRAADHHRSGSLPTTRWRLKQLQPLLPGATVNMEQKELLAASVGIDMRHPFASRHLAHLLVSLPCALKADPLRPKAFMRDALAGVVPASVGERRTMSNYLGVVAHRVDAGRCMDLIRASGVRLPFIDYDRLFRDADEEPERLTVFFLVYITRAHAFGARAAGSRAAAG